MAGRQGRGGVDLHGHQVHQAPGGCYCVRNTSVSSERGADRRRGDREGGRRRICGGRGSPGPLGDGCKSNSTGRWKLRLMTMQRSETQLKELCVQNGVCGSCLADAWGNCEAHPSAPFSQKGLTLSNSVTKRELFQHCCCRCAASLRLSFLIYKTRLLSTVHLTALPRDLLYQPWKG